MVKKKKVVKKKVKATKQTKKKLETLSETDGMATEKEEGFEPSTLDQVWGDDGLSKYSTMDYKSYQTKIDDMAKADLKNEAIRVGLLPIDNMVQLKLRLLKQFKVHVSGYKRPFTSYTPSAKVSRDVQRILDEGK